MALRRRFISTTKHFRWACLLHLREECNQVLELCVVCGWAGMICVIISDSVKDQLCCLPWRVNCIFAELSFTKSSMGCFILSIVLEPYTDCIRFSYVIILLRMCNWAKISYMPWFQALLFQYKSSTSSEIAECKRVKVNILLVAVCGTFSIVKLVFCSFF